MSEVARATGIHRNRLADKVAGRRDFTEPEILGLAGYFGVEPGHLFQDPLELLGVTRLAVAPGVPGVTMGYRIWAGEWPLQMAA